jgi:hypothetical protein
MRPFVHHSKSPVEICFFVFVTDSYIVEDSTETVTNCICVQPLTLRKNEAEEVRERHRVEENSRNRKERSPPPQKD